MKSGLSPNIFLRKGICFKRTGLSGYFLCKALYRFGEANPPNRSEGLGNAPPPMGEDRGSVGKCGKIGGNLPRPAK